MLNITREVYRVLRDGSPFLFNIFDYFDNENNIVFSAMGKKRMILGYYIVNIFSDVGFQVCANIPWDKGHIEGNRNFNQGNFSPYYQAPHNCWEHIFVFSKGTPQFDLSKLPTILKATPVIKMFNGQNLLGHSAPYPEDIPRLLFNLLAPGSKILDPFSGSMTTGRLAYLNGYKSINIDYKKEYCELGLKLLEKELLPQKQLRLVV
jgi:DNA modification methylase